MDIVYVYQRKRREFGRRPHFGDRQAEVIVDIQRDDSLRQQFIDRDACELATQNTRDFSEHEVDWIAQRFDATGEHGAF